MKNKTPALYQKRKRFMTDKESTPNHFNTRRIGQVRWFKDTEHELRRDRLLAKKQVLITN